MFGIGKSRKQITILLTVFLIIQLIVIGLLCSSHPYYVGETIIMIVAFIIISILEIKLKLYLGGYLSGILMITIVSHNFLGRYVGLYNTSSIYDRIQHVFGIYSFALFTYILVNKITGKPDVSRFREFVFIISLGMSLGAAVEIAEFLADTFFHPPVRNQPGLLDTDLDLISNTAGAFIAAFHWFINLKFRRNRHG